MNFDTFSSLVFLHPACFIVLNYIVWVFIFYMFYKKEKHYLSCYGFRDGLGVGPMDGCIGGC
jgi:hypothetical protein